MALSMVSSSATLQMLGPPVLLELAYIRMIDRPSLAHLRSNIVAVLRKRRVGGSPQSLCDGAARAV